MRDILAYLKYRLLLIGFTVVSLAIALSVQALSGGDMRNAWYTAVIVGFLLVLTLIIDGSFWIRRLRVVRGAMYHIDTALQALPDPVNALEASYAQLAQAIMSEREHYRHRLTVARGEQLEYYTLWIHQIKTPIAALGLVLERGGRDDDGVIRQELFKIEQYADLALRYAKLADITSDVIFEDCELAALVHAAVKKFGILFVYGRLRVDISPISEVVISDKRWLSFIIEQIVSNAIKYTHTGGISIYVQEGRLVIRDTGIGIRASDLPRIFEKGYTGYNGRMYDRASGVGLYLAKKAADAIGVKLDVTSEVGVGTAVRLSFPHTDSDIFL